jgi:hypothetical protein
MARTWWMRLLFAGRRRYHCTQCGREMFVSENVLHAHLATRR